MASGALYGAKRLTVEDIQTRVASRYPEAQRFLDGPELDRLLELMPLSPCAASSRTGRGTEEGLRRD